MKKTLTMILILALMLSTFSYAGVATPEFIGTGMMTVDEGATKSIVSSQLGADDPDSDNDMLRFTITSAPSHGQLELKSNPGVAVNSFIQLSVIGSNIQYVHDGSETTSDSFTFKVSNGTNELTGQTFNITVNPVDDQVPTITTNLVMNVNEGTSQRMTDLLKAEDIDTANGDLRFYITTAPAHGSIVPLYGPPTPLTDFSSEDIIKWIKYVHDGSETTSDSFIFKVSDGTNELTGQTFNITINPINDAPIIITNTGMTLDEGASKIITTSMLESDDLDSGDITAVYTVTRDASKGQLENINNPGVAISTFTEENLKNSEIQYSHDGSDSTSDYFVFKVSDGSKERTFQMFNITINPVDDAIRYSVVFKDVDGSLLKTQEVVENTGALAPTSPTREGYTFLGWDVAFDNISSDLTVTAKYTINQYEVAYNANGGTAVSSVDLDYNTLLVAPIAPTKDGYTFVGWYKAIDLQNSWNFSSDRMPAENIVLYAKWEAPQGAVTLVASPNAVETDTNFYKTFNLSLNNDAIFSTISSAAISLSGSLQALTVESVIMTTGSSIGVTTGTSISVTLSGNLSDEGIGAITIDASQLVDSTTHLSADVQVVAKLSYVLTYMGNGNTGGGVPLDSGIYHTSDHGTVLGNVNKLYRTGYTFKHWNTKADGSGNSYSAGESILVSTSNITLYAIWEKTSSTPNHNTSTNKNTTNNVNTTQEGITRIMINGQVENAGIETASGDVGNKKVAVKMDAAMISNRIKEVSNNQTTDEQRTKNVIEIPVMTQNAKELTITLTGDIIKEMDQNNFNLLIKTNTADYRMPAKEVGIDKVAQTLGIPSDQLATIDVEVKMDQVDQASLDQNEMNAEINGYTIIFPAMNFEIVAKVKTNTGEEKEVIVSKFSQYVQKTIRVPAGVDPKRITTGIVYNTDGTISHVPTTIFMEDGVYYASINSMTNSMYSLIGNPVTVASVENHWSKDAVNDLASRLIIKNPETFKPNDNITRGDFAEYITKALGLYRTGQEIDDAFTDITMDDECACAIMIASEYGIINGYPDGTFKSDAQISRQEAMVMYASAMSLVNLQTQESTSIETYDDADDIADWALSGVNKTVGASIFSGKTKTTINPNDTLTYAEAASAIQNLLIKSELISH